MFSNLTAQQQAQLQQELQARLQQVKQTIYQLEMTKQQIKQQQQQLSQNYIWGPTQFELERRVWEQQEKQQQNQEIEKKILELVEEGTRIEMQINQKCNPIIPEKIDKHGEITKIYEYSIRTLKPSDTTDKEWYLENVYAIKVDFDNIESQQTCLEAIKLPPEQKLQIKESIVSRGGQEVGRIVEVTYNGREVVTLKEHLMAYGKWVVEKDVAIDEKWTSIYSPTASPEEVRPPKKFK